jgi:hypothetical protein
MLEEIGQAEVSRIAPQEIKAWWCLHVRETVAQFNNQGR